MHRRDFVGGFVVFLMAPIALSCSGGEGETTGSGECNGAGADTTVDEGHSHFICVPSEDLDNPPADGATYSSSEDDQHRHSITVTQADLQKMANSQAVTLTTSNDHGHTHDVTLARHAVATG